MYKLLLTLIILTIPINTFAQGNCSNGNCDGGPSMGGWENPSMNNGPPMNNGPSQQQFEQNVDNINTNFAKFKKDILELKEFQAKQGTEIKDLHGRADKSVTNIATLDANGKLNTKTLTELKGAAALKTDLSAIKTEQTTFFTTIKSDIFKTVNNSFAGFGKKLGTIENKVNDPTLRNKVDAALSISKTAISFGSDLSMLKWAVLGLGTGGIGLGGVALGVGLYALKKRGPKIVKNVIEHVHQHKVETNQQETNQQEPKPSIYIPSDTVQTDKYPTEGVHPHIKQINEHDNRMGAREVKVYVEKPGPQLTQPSFNYVPVESNDFRIAYEKAVQIAAQRYPGQIHCLDYVNKLTEQILNGNPVKQ